MRDRYKSDFVNVVARIRPSLDDQEDECCLQKMADPADIAIPERQKTYFLDHIFDNEATQRDIYDNTVKHLVDKLMLGYNCTVFAYGQTGCGKTYTMGTDGMDLDNKDEQGIIMRTIYDIMTRIDDNVETSINASFYEIYNEKVYDLLRESDTNVPLKVKGFQICGLTIKRVNHYSEGRAYLERGGEKRHKGETRQNPTSSRSHAVFTIYINLKNENAEFNAKLNLVDLAGSECVRRTCTEGSQFQEGVNINRGLLSIGQVISVLSKATNNNHIPYRESVITTVLKDSLDRNNYITLIACVSSNILDVSDTIQTLDFAQRAKKLKNKPELNMIVDQPNNPPYTSSSKTRSTPCSVLPYRTPLKRPPPFTTSTYINNSSNNRKPITSFFSTPSLHSIRSTSVKNCQRAVGKATVSSANVNIASDVVPFCSTFMSDLKGDHSTVSVNELSRASSVVSSRLEASVLSPMIKSYLETKHNDAMAKLDDVIQEKLNTLVNKSLMTAGVIKLRKVLHVTSKTHNYSSPEDDCIVSKNSPVPKQYSRFIENLTTPIRTRANLPKRIAIAESATNTERNGNSAVFKMPQPMPRKRKLLINELDLKSASPSKCRRSVRLQEKGPKTNLDHSILKSGERKRRNSIRLKDLEIQNRRSSVRLRTKIANKSRITHEIDSKSETVPIPAPRRKVASILKGHYNDILEILNCGSERKLTELSSIGLKTAKQLHYYRSIKGKFNKISDLAGMPWKGKGYERFLEANFLEIDKI